VLVSETYVSFLDYGVPIYVAYFILFSYSQYIYVSFHYDNFGAVYMLLFQNNIIYDFALKKNYTKIPAQLCIHYTRVCINLFI